MSEAVFDVAVVGAGPAGTTVANILAKNEKRVVLVDRDKFPRKATSFGWLNVRAAPLLKELGVELGPHMKRSFQDVRFCNADFSKSAKPNFESAAGYLIDRVAFTNDLLAAAASAGVTTRLGSAVSDLQLRENTVSLSLVDGKAIESKLLVLASGRGGMLLDRAGYSMEGGASAMWTAQVDGHLETSLEGEPRVTVVLGLDRQGSFGVCCQSDTRVSVSINWLGEQSEAITALISLCRLAYQHEVLPIDLATHATKAKLVRSPASLALDLDTHVGKHSLVIGDAGGFISAASNEGIFPAMWSAQIAAEVLLTALGSRQSQDELMAFDSAWRMKMADYLRSPNTDHQFLLPLIFSNQPMADRMGAAFFSGENI